MANSEHAAEMTDAPTTPFIETEALLAVQEGDEDHAKHLLSTMSWSELSGLKNTARCLAELCEREMGGKR